MTTNRSRPRRKKWPFPPMPSEAAPARALVFAPLAWLKLQFLCHAGPTEVAGFGLSHPDDPLYLEDVIVVRQRCTLATVGFDDSAVADLFDDMADAGIGAERFARVWVHTHPGASVDPSGTDEATFARAFGGCDWAIMAILGRTGQTSARLQFNVGPRGAIALRTAVDWAAWPAVIDAQPSFADRLADWQHEYASKVEVVPLVAEKLLRSPGGASGAIPFHPDPFDFFPGGLHAFE